MRFPPQVECVDQYIISGWISPIFIALVRLVHLILFVYPLGHLWLDIKLLSIPFVVIKESFMATIFDTLLALMRWEALGFQWLGFNAIVGLLPYSIGVTVMSTVQHPWLFSRPIPNVAGIIGPTCQWFPSWLSAACSCREWIFRQCFAVGWFHLVVGIFSLPLHQPSWPVPNVLLNW